MAARKKAKEREQQAIKERGEKFRTEPQQKEPNPTTKFLGKRTGDKHEAFDPYKRLKEWIYF